MATTGHDLWDKFWKDGQGNLAVWQTPNKWLIGWVVLTILSLLFSGRLADVFAVAGEVLLVIWSLLEIFKGDSYFRRLLGLAVLAFAIASLIKSF